MLCPAIYVVLLMICTSVVVLLLVFVLFTSVAEVHGAITNVQLTLIVFNSHKVCVAGYFHISVHGLLVHCTRTRKTRINGLMIFWCTDVLSNLVFDTIRFLIFLFFEK